MNSGLLGRVSTGNYVKNRVIQGFLVLILALPLACQAAAPAVSTAAPALKAIVPADNDITPAEDKRTATELIPQVVAQKFSKIVSDTYDWYLKNDPDCAKSTDDCGLKKSTLYGRAYRLDAPAKNNAYVFVLEGLGGQTSYLFVIYNPDTNQVTVDPVSIYGKWLDTFYGDNDPRVHLRKPFVSFTTVDGKAALVAEDYAHNGTDYNAIIYRYFVIGPDLALTQVLALEAIDLVEMDYQGSYGAVLTRKLTLNGDGTAEIDDYLQKALDDKSPQLVGDVSVRSSAPGKPYKIVSEKVINQRFKDLLVTFDDNREDGIDGENAFLAKGDTLFY